MITGVHRLARPAAPWAAIGMAVAATSFWSLEFDTSILSDSLYANSIVFAFGFLFWGLATGSRAVLAASSAAIAATIATRPAGLFLIVTFAITVIYLWHTGRTWRQIAAFAIPLPALMLALSLYNLAVAGVFGITAWGEANIAVATFTFWEQDPSYPPEVNDPDREDSVEPWSDGRGAPHS